jgi:hypothetical protein
MKHSLLVVLAAATILSIVGCKPKNDVTELAAKAESGFFVAGTLATLGSFEWDVAPLTNHAATALHNVAVAVKDGRVSKAEGQEQVDEIVHAHDLLEQALAACAQSPKTGKCTKDEAAARALLDQARAALADIP